MRVLLLKIMGALGFFLVQRPPNKSVPVTKSLKVHKYRPKSTQLGNKTPWKILSGYAYLLNMRENQLKEIKKSPYLFWISP